MAPEHGRPRDTQHLDQTTADWLKRFGVIRDGKQEAALLRIQTGKLAAFAFPGSTRERLQATSDLLAWLFIFDDFHADGPYRRNREGLKRRHEEMRRVLADDCKVVGDDPFVASLDELYGRLATLAPRAWLQRLSRDIAGFFRACETELEFRAGHATPPGWPSSRLGF